MKRITMAEIKAHDWFQKDYVPAVPFDNDDEDSQLDLVLPAMEVYAYGQPETICGLKIDANCTCLYCTPLITKFWFPLFFFLQKEINPSPGDKTTHQINAFQLIGMASSLDLSGFFEEEV